MRAHHDTVKNVYEGRAGLPHTDSILVPNPDGALRPVQVQRVVHAQLTPELMAPALEGRLHHISPQQKLSLSFVWHDPHKQLFVLVVPDSIQHEELRERARLYDKLADDNESEIPPYVRNFRVAVGFDALRALLQEKPAAVTQLDDNDFEEVPSATLTEGLSLQPIESTSEISIDDLSDDITDGDIEDLEEADLEDITSVGRLGSPTDRPEAIEGATVEGRDVHLRVRVGSGNERSFRQDRTDLVPQFLLVQGYPVVLLTLVEKGVDRPYAKRIALDPRAKTDRAVLEALAKKFVVHVHVLNEQGSLVHDLTVRAAREQNVSLILERVAQLRIVPNIEAPTAMARALSVPPPISQPDLPFTNNLDTDELNQLIVLVEQLAEWSDPDRVEQAMFAFGVPRDVIDQAFLNGIKSAVRAGIALAPALQERAISLGVASTHKTLVQDLLSAFHRLNRKQSGLGEERIARNWRALLESASEEQIDLAPDIELAAWHDLFPGRKISDHPNRAELFMLGMDELMDLLLHPGARHAAVVEIVRRGDGSLAAPLFAACRNMPSWDMAAVLARLVSFGEAAGDCLIDGLSDTKPAVRHGTLLALGELKLRRAIVPLLHFLQHEESDLWSEAARVLGEFGMASLRAITRLLPDARENTDRFAFALAHACNHGCLTQVQQLEADPNSRVAKIAREALGSRDAARNQARSLHGTAEATSNDSREQFARNFYAELAASASDVTLAAQQDRAPAE